MPDQTKNEVSVMKKEKLRFTRGDDDEDATTEGIFYEELQDAKRRNSLRHGKNLASTKSKVGKRKK